VQIGMKLLGELAIGLANVVCTCIRLDPEHLIGRLRCHLLSALPQPTALGACSGGGLFDANGYGALRAAAVDGQLNLIADPREPDAVAQFRTAAHRCAVDRNHEIIGPQPGALGGRTGLDPGDYRTLRIFGAQRLTDVRGEILDRDTDATALDLPVAGQLVHDLARHVDRDGKADADIAAARRDDCRIDADDP